MRASSVPTLLATALAPLTRDDFIRLAQRQLTMKAAYARRGIDYDGLTSQIALPVIEPARVMFRDARGQWIEGVSEPKIDPNHFRIWLEVRAYAPCMRHAPRPCTCRKRLTGLREGPANLLTNQFAGFVRAGVFGTTTTVTDTGTTGRSITNALNGGVNAASTLITSGTGGAAATVADVAMQTATETVAAGAPSAISGSGATGSFTIAGTITATTARAYTECGIQITTTTNTWNFLVAHDSYTTLNVSTSGTLQVTYTVQNQ